MIAQPYAQLTRPSDRDGEANKLNPPHCKDSTPLNYIVTLLTFFGEYKGQLSEVPRYLRRRRIFLPKPQDVYPPWQKAALTNTTHLPNFEVLGLLLSGRDVFAQERAIFGPWIPSCCCDLQDEYYLGRAQPRLLAMPEGQYIASATLVSGDLNKRRKIFGTCQGNWRLVDA